MAGRRVPISPAIAVSGAVAVPIGWWAAGPAVGVIVFLVWAVVAVIHAILAYKLGAAGIAANVPVDAQGAGVAFRVGAAADDESVDR
jgi:hypothetical protein